MLDITNEMEAALAFVMRHPNHQRFDDSTMPSEPFIDLRDVGMLDMQTDSGHSLVLIHRVTPTGVMHYQETLGKRRCFVQISQEADELLGAIVANEAYRKAGRTEALFDEGDGSAETFRELSRAELLDVIWADNRAYRYSATDKGRSYVKGFFLEELERQTMQVNNYVNAYGGAATSDATAIINNQITLKAALKAINEVDVKDEIKMAAVQAITEMDDAAESGDKGGFADALEKVASVVKSATTLADAMLPYVGQLIGNLFS